MGILKRLFGSKTKEKYTLSLIDAVNSGDKEKVSLSITKGADVSARDSQGGTALIIAVYNGDNDIVDMLLDNGAIIDEKEYNTGKTALIYAVEKGHKDTVELLIQKGANVNEVDEKGNAAIMFATSETAELLIRNGANVNTTNCFGYTPLQFFRERGWEKMVSILENAGAK